MKWLLKLSIVFSTFGVLGCQPEPTNPVPLDAAALEAIEREDQRVAKEESGL